MTTGTESRNAPREALALRGWALRVLAGEEAGAPPAADAEGWRLFLRAERCAAPLRARVGAGHPRVEEGFELEVQRVLSARAMLRHLDRALATLGTRGIALKGAAPLLLEGEAVDLLDLDLLVDEATVRPLAAALEEAGFDVGRDADQALPADAPGGWERAARVADGSVPVELHVTVPFLPDGVDVRARVRHTSLANVDLPAAPAHLWHVLVHGAAHHPERRGQLRDVLLLRGALDACTAAEADAVRARLERDPRAGVLRRVLRFAASLDGDDLFAAEAMLRYTLLGAHLPGMGDRRAGWLSAAAFALLAGDGEYRRLWFGGGRGAWGAGARSAVPGLDLPVRLARFLWRGAHLAGVTPRAFAAARAARLSARAG